MNSSKDYDYASHELIIAKLEAYGFNNIYLKLPYKVLGAPNTLQLFFVPSLKLYFFSLFKVRLSPSKKFVFIYQNESP